MDTDPIMLAAEASFEIERLQIMARGKVLPQDQVSRVIFNAGFFAGALYALREVKIDEAKLLEAIDGPTQPAPLAPRLPVPGLPLAAPPGEGLELLGDYTRPQPRPAALDLSMAERRAGRAARARRHRPLQPRRKFR